MTDVFFPEWVNAMHEKIKQDVQNYLYGVDDVEKTETYLSEIAA